jgi:hypothetical protein
MKVRAGLAVARAKQCSVFKPIYTRIVLLAAIKLEEFGRRVTRDE